MKIFNTIVYGLAGLFLIFFYFGLLPGLKSNIANSTPIGVLVPLFGAYFVTVAAIRIKKWSKITHIKTENVLNILAFVTGIILFYLLLDISRSGASIFYTSLIVAPIAMCLFFAASVISLLGLMKKNKKSA